MKIPKLKTQKITVFLKDLPKKLSNRAFFTFLILLFLSLILGEFIFYTYFISIKEAKIEVSEKILQFQEKTYQRILEVWQEKEKQFKEADSKEYFNLFKEKKETQKQIIPTQEKKEPEAFPQPPIGETQELQTATTLTEFYKKKGENLPTLSERARLWQEKGLGSKDEYIGSEYQNFKLLEALKKEFTL